MSLLLVLAALAADPPAGGAEAVGDGVRMEVHALVQGLAEIDAKTGRAGARLQRVRPDLRLQTADGGAGARIQAELAGATARILDAAVTVTPGEAWRVRAGRFLLPTGRQQLTPVGRLAFPGFAPTADRWRRGRLVGAEVRWGADPRHTVTLGAFDASPIDRGALAVVRITTGIGDAVPYDEMVVRAGGGRGLSVEAAGQFSERGAPVVVFGMAGRWDRARLEVASTIDTGPAAQWGAFGQVDVGILPDRVQASVRVDRSHGVVDRAWTVESGTAVFDAGGHVRVLVALAAVRPEGASWSARGRLQVQWML